MSARQPRPSRITTTRGRGSRPTALTSGGERVLVGPVRWHDRARLVDRRVELLEQLVVRRQVVGPAGTVHRLGRLATQRERTRVLVDHVGRAGRLAPGELVDATVEVVAHGQGVELVGRTPVALVVEPVPTVEPDR